jgi:hypothetical protein
VLFREQLERLQAGRTLVRKNPSRLPSAPPRASVTQLLACALATSGTMSLRFIR